MRKKFLYLFIASIAFACNSKQKPIKPTVSSVSESIYASGIIKSKNQYEAFSPVNGIIDTLFVSEGDLVKKGSPLLFISSDVQRLNEENAALSADFADIHNNQGKLEDARISVEFSRNKRDNDSLMFMRQKNLWLQKIGSKVDYEQKELAYQNSKAAYASAMIHYNDLKRQLNYNAAQSKKNLLISKRLASDYLLKSHIDGRVYIIHKMKGEIVGPQTPLAVIGDHEDFILELQVDEYDILKVRTGLPVKVSLDSYQGMVFTATVTKINPLMDKLSRTFLVEAEFVKPPKLLYPNISFEANIILATKENALLIPRSYILNDSIVFKSNGDKVLVRTGLRDYRKIEILAGITANDELILPKQ